MASENESEKRETSADVADEIRRAVESMGDEMSYTVSAGTMRRVADRIEAAWKRQEKTYLDQIRDAMNMWGHEKHIAEHAQKPTVGNAAAMREALIRCDAIAQLPEVRNEQSIKDMRNIIKHALSAPPRQCDVGTAAEQERRYKATGEVYHTSTLTDALAWAQTPYEEEGGAE